MNDWYSYQQNEAAQPALQPAQPPKKKNRTLLWVLLAAGGALLLSAAVFFGLTKLASELVIRVSSGDDTAEYVLPLPEDDSDEDFFDDFMDDFVEEEDGSFSYSFDFGDPFGFGQEESDETEDQDMFEYFENYFTGTSDVNIAQADTAPEVELSISAAADQTLTLQQVYAKVSPSVVGINTYVDGVHYAWGTGIVFDAAGYIVTNEHVLEGADAAEVVFTDGTTYEAMLIGSDAATDIAVLKIETGGAALVCAEFGDSAAMRVGDEVSAIGNPLGEEYAGTMTNGIISAIDRSISYNGHSMTLLQTNAALNEGNSGGPLINAAGQVIGITNMKIMSSYYTSVEGIGFAIPTSVVKAVVDELCDNGVVLGEPTIGITAGSVSAEAMELYGLPEGVYVSEVNENSDAYAQGVQVGDVITAVNGVPVTTVAEVNAVKEDLTVGDPLTLTIYREGETFDLTITLVDKSLIR